MWTLKDASSLATCPGAKTWIRKRKPSKSKTATRATARKPQSQERDSLSFWLDLLPVTSVTFWEDGPKV